MLESPCLESEKEPEEEEEEEEEEPDMQEENSDEDIIDCELTEQCSDISTTPAPSNPAPTDTVKRKLSPIFERELRPRRCKK